MEAEAFCRGTSDTLKAEARAEAQAADDGTKRASRGKQSVASLKGGSQNWMTLPNLLHAPAHAGRNSDHRASSRMGQACWNSTKELGSTNDTERSEPRGVQGRRLPEPISEGIAAAVCTYEHAVARRKVCRRRREVGLVDGGVWVEDHRGFAVVGEEVLEALRVLEVGQHHPEEVPVLEVWLELHEVPRQQLACIPVPVEHASMCHCSKLLGTVSRVVSKKQAMASLRATRLRPGQRRDCRMKSSPGLIDETVGVTVGVRGSASRDGGGGGGVAASICSQASAPKLGCPLGERALLCSGWMEPESRAGCSLARQCEPSSKIIRPVPGSAGPSSGYRVRITLWGVGLVMLGRLPMLVAADAHGCAAGASGGVRSMQVLERD